MKNRSDFGKFIAVVIMAAGTCMVLAAVICSLSPSLRRLEKQAGHKSWMISAET